MPVSASSVRTGRGRFQDTSARQRTLRPGTITRALDQAAGSNAPTAPQRSCPPCPASLALALPVSLPEQRAGSIPREHMRCREVGLPCGSRRRRWPGISPHGGRPLRRPCLRSALPGRGSARRAGGGGPPRVSQALPSRSADSAPRERKAAPPPAMPRSAAEPRPFPPGHSPSITTAGAPPWARLRVTWSARREPPAPPRPPVCRTTCPLAGGHPAGQRRGVGSSPSATPPQPTTVSFSC